jgi:hypothetical protein
VLDGFVGSGTTLIAAEKTGRRGYGIEIDPQYCDVMIRRRGSVCGLEAVPKATGSVLPRSRQSARLRLRSNPLTGPVNQPANSQASVAASERRPSLQQVQVSVGRQAENTCSAMAKKKRLST